VLAVDFGDGRRARVLVEQEARELAEPGALVGRAWRGRGRRARGKNVRVTLRGALRGARAGRGGGRSSAGHDAESTRARASRARDTGPAAARSRVSLA
jgi:hypothetical protein